MRRVLIAGSLFLGARAGAAGLPRPFFPRPAIPAHQPAARPLDRRYSLWDGGTAALALPDDQSARYRPLETQAAAPAEGASAGPGLPGEMFVAVQFGAATDQDQLKDAVADLSRATGFRPDARFSPVSAAGGAGVKVFGWLAAARLGEAVRSPALRCLEISRATTRPMTALGAGAQVQIVVGLRRFSGLTPAQDDERFSSAMRELEDDAQFQWDKTVGYQAIPGSADSVLLVLGRAPARLLGRLMENPAVVKIQAFPGLAPEPSVAVAPRGSAGRFLEYAARYPLLLIVTALLFLPPFRPRFARRPGRRG